MLTPLRTLTLIAALALAPAAMAQQAQVAFGGLKQDTTLPVEVEALSVQLRYRRHRLDVRATHETLSVFSHPEVAPMIEIAYRSHHRKLNPGDRREFRLLRPEDRARGNVAAE